MAFVEFGEFLPDQPDYKNPGSNNIRNVLPRTKGSYAPMPALNTITGSISATCIGGAFVRDNAGNVDGFAGTSSNLYRYAAGSTNWQNVSRVGGYSVSAGETWQFAQFDQRVVATNINVSAQTFLIGTDSVFSGLSPGAPRGRYVASPRDFCMLANTTDPVNGPRPQRVWWSALADPTLWPAPGTISAAAVQSDYQDLLGDGGWNQGLVAGLVNADVAIFQERRIWRGMFIGSPLTFSFMMADAGRGTPAPGSIIQAGGVCYFLSDSGWCGFDGAQVRTIGDQKFDNFFWSDVDKNNLFRISAAVDPEDKIIFWAYPGAGNSGGTPNRILAYHYTLDRATIIDSITLEYLLKGLTVGYTLDQLNQFGNLDTLPFSLDSRVWTGGRLALGAFDTAHKFGFFDGANIAATIDTTENELTENGKTYVNRMWGETDAPAALLQLGYRDRLADPVTWTNPSPMSRTTSSAGVRGTGRFHRGRMTIPANAAWTFAQGIDYDGRPAGKR